MSRTIKKDSKWYTKEHPEARRHQRKGYRLMNKTNIKKEIFEHEEAPRTEGWMTW